MTGVIESQSEEEVKTIFRFKTPWKAYCYISI